MCHIRRAALSDNTSDILKELHKTGYPTEIIAAAVMKRRGWAVVHNPTYVDDIEHRGREYDIHAGRVYNDGPIQLGVFLAAECKKSEKPWVFFTTDRDPEG
jgi:hypothetical protein